MVLALVAATNMYSKQNDDKEHLTDTSYDMTAGMVILNLVSTAVFCYAIYLSFKCKKGFDLGEFLLACCCFWLYVPYRLAVPCK